MSKAPDFLGMSDEDFEKQPLPEAGAEGASKDATEEVTTETTTEEPKPGDAETTENTEVTGETKTETQTEEVTGEKPAAASKPAKKQAGVVETKPDATADKTSKEAKPDQAGKSDDKSEGEQTEGKDKTGKEASTEAVATDYEAFYKQIMTPFKANGRTVELKSPEEAIALMQMGANYTKKMQELVPHRKVLQMLQNNGLMDEGKLSFLIDIEKKDPEAIKKLIKDAGLDPMEIDTSTEPAYSEGNHRVSDEEVAFHSTLEDMKSTPERVETLKVINGNWDQASKEALWKNPEIMAIIHDQRENGIYDRIDAEVNRQRTLGAIPANVPFLQAYKIIGDRMTEAGAFADLNLNKPAAGASPPGSKGQVVATRVAAPKAAVANGDKAAAASTNRSTPAKGKGPVTNPLAMSDDEFLKQFDGRL